MTHARLIPRERSDRFHSMLRRYSSSNRTGRCDTPNYRQELGRSNDVSLWREVGNNQILHVTTSGAFLQLNRGRNYLCGNRNSEGRIRLRTKSEATDLEKTHIPSTCGQKKSSRWAFFYRFKRHQHCPPVAKNRLRVTFFPSRPVLQ